MSAGLLCRWTKSLYHDDDDDDSKYEHFEMNCCYPTLNSWKYKAASPLLKESKTILNLDTPDTLLLFLAYYVHIGECSFNI